MSRGKKTLLIVLLAFAIAVLLLEVLLLCMPRQEIGSHALSPEGPVNPATCQNAALVKIVQISPEPVTESADTPMETENAIAALTLRRLLLDAGMEIEDVPGSQLIIVESSGADGMLYCFECTDGVWREALGSCTAWLGSSGVSWEKTEGDNTTPGGLYRVGMAFGFECPEGLTLPFRTITEESYWIDDPDSVWYNTWVEGTQEQDWDSAEHLMDYAEAYALAVVIEYNTAPVVPGAGSAIFLHCGEAYTAGCVSVRQSDLEAILAWLHPDADSVILIY